jgi:hypothetical protein
VKKLAENLFKITLGMKGSSGSLFEIGAFFIWSSVFGYIFLGCII